MTLIAWRYGATRLLRNVSAMIGYRPTILWKYVWVAITPSLLMFAFVFTFLEFKPLEYAGEPI